MSLGAESMQNLPLPLTQLHARALHAKTALERHQTAFYLWSAAIKLAGSVAIASESSPSPPTGADAGHWLKLLQETLPTLAEREPEFQPLRDLWEKPLAGNFPRSAELELLLRETEDGAVTPAKEVTVGEFFNRLADYGAAQVHPKAFRPRENEYYEWIGRALLAAVVELLGEMDTLYGRQLLFVSDVRQQSSGAWLVEQFELRGETPLRLESFLLPPDVSLTTLPQAGRVYLRALPSAEETQAVNTMQALFPWVHFELEGNEFFFFNRRRKDGGANYLCFTSGRVLKQSATPQTLEVGLPELLPSPGAAETANIWADQSQADNSPDAPKNPKRMGEYELVSCLGRGGMGVVYRAWHQPLKRQVGLKCMLRSGDPKSEARFAREIRALGRVNHPHLVKIYSSGTHDDQMYFAMELVEGTDLASVCQQLQSATGANPKLADWDHAVTAACRATHSREVGLDTDTFGPSTTATMQVEIGPQGARPAGEKSTSRSSAAKTGTKLRTGVQSPSRQFVERVVEVIRQIADAVAALHEANIVHRDIKPGNIMLTEDGRQAVLMDLGLAQLVDEIEGRLTHTLDYIGTLRYSSPEQLRAAHHVDFRTDIYSLGATLWELLTLQPLFGAGRTTSPAQLMADIQNSNPARPRRWNPKIPADLEVIVLKCLEKNPARRYANASELAADLERWQQGLPVQAQPPTLGYVLGKFITRHAKLLTTVAVLMFVAMVAGAWAVYQIREARDRAEIALVKEQQAHETATRYFQEARNVTDRTMMDVSDLLKFFPDAHTRGVALIEETLAAYERLAQEKPDDLLVQLALAKTRYQVALAFDNIDLLERSEQELKTVETQLESLKAENREADAALLDQARIQRGRVLTELGQYDQAQSMFARAKESLQSQTSEPQQREALAQLSIEWGRLWLRQQELGKARAMFDEAAASYQQLMQTEPKPTYREGWANALTDRGRLLVQEGKLRSGVEEIRKAIDQLAELRKEQDSLSRQELMGYAQITLGNSLRLLGEDAARMAAYRAALEDYEGLLQVYPNAPRLLRTCAISATNLAYVLLKLGQNEQAYLLTEKAVAMLQLLPVDGSNHTQDAIHLAACQTLASHVFFQFGKFAEAESLAAMALGKLPAQVEGNPVDPAMAERRGMALRCRAAALSALKRTSEAEEIYQQAIQEFQAAQESHPTPEILAEHLAGTLADLGDLYFQTDRSELASSQYARVIELRMPLAAPEQLHDFARFLATCCDSKGCEEVSTCKLARKALENQPDNPRYLEVLGLACLRKGDLAEAKKHLKRAVEISKTETTHPFRYLCLALVNQQLGEMGLAKENWETARNLPLMAQNQGDPIVQRLQTEVEIGFGASSP